MKLNETEVFKKLKLVDSHILNKFWNMAIPNIEVLGELEHSNNNEYILELFIASIQRGMDKEARELFSWLQLKNNGIFKDTEEILEDEE